MQVTTAALPSASNKISKISLDLSLRIGGYSQSPACYRARYFGVRAVFRRRRNSPLFEPQSTLWEGVRDENN
jgi:hypothetical protein